MRSRIAALTGSGLFLILAPGTLAGLLPYLITGWTSRSDFGDSGVAGAAGAILIALGAALLVECFIRFAWVGRGTPAPVAPTETLVVSGLYRHVRNPMYLAVVTLILGQALLLGRAGLVGYCALVWTSFHLFVIGYEEPTLERQFPDDYRRFTAAVPRWLPRLTPWRG